MKILEIKNNLVKISYDVNDNLALSGFVVIEDTNCPYVAQIVNLKADGGNNYAILKLLFTFDEAGVLKNYNGTIPSENAQITSLPAEEILRLFRVGSPVFIGNVSGSNNPFCLDLDVFMSGLLICSNNLINSGKLLTNIFPQIVKRNKKVVLLDTTGDYYSENSFVFGKNFKLPLNSEFLDFIFDNDLEGVEPVSKAVIQDIFSEVKNYLSELPQGYLPIDLLVNVVQEQYNETKIPELVLLKNKLIRYKDANVFASGNDDIFILRSKVAHTDSLVVDVSQCEMRLMKKLIGFVYDTITTIDSDTCLFININNDFADKKLLRKTMEYNNIFSTIICSHEFKYLPDLKQIIPNIIFFAPQTGQHDFAGYNTFLSKLNGEEFIVYGEFTQKIPFIVQLAQYDDSMEFEVYSQPEDEVDEVDETDFDNVAENNGNDEDITDTVVDSYEGEIEEVEESSDILQTEEISEVEDIPENNEVMEQVDFSDDLSDEKADEKDNLAFKNIDSNTVSDLTFEDDGNVISISADDKIGVPTESDNSAGSAQMTDFENEVISDREILEEQVANDVDSSFYKKIDEENLDDENKISPDVLTKNDDITDEDLDYIESLNFSDDELGDNSDEAIEIVEKSDADDLLSDLPDLQLNDNEPQKEIKNGIEDEKSVVEKPVPADKSEKGNNYIPIYTPDEFTKVETNEEETVPDFKTGDVISHPKYGQGVVEKMINYGNKTLCSINFVNLGRRLLDPAISDIQLVGRDGAVVE